MAEAEASGPEHQSIQNYGSLKGGCGEGEDYDGNKSTVLCDILEHKEMKDSFNGTYEPDSSTEVSDGNGSSGSDNKNGDNSDHNYDDMSSCTYDSDDIEARFSDISGKSFHLGDHTRMSINNILVNQRRTDSFAQYGEDYQLVPTQLKKNVRVVEDMNMDYGGRGRLYLASYSFFDNNHETKYALTIQPNIYKQLFTEVHDAYNVPCGLFFCCHGGDGAHTGVSHNDFVDIKLAWVVFIFVIGCLLGLELING